MNKHELIDIIATELNVTKALSTRFIDTFTDTVQNAVAKGDKVTLLGFGAFYCTETIERQGRNPKTGTAMTINAAIRPRFKPGDGFRNLVNRK
jgi:DNA-binding protein HU-beta